MRTSGQREHFRFTAYALIIAMLFQAFLVTLHITALAASPLEKHVICTPDGFKTVLMANDRLAKNSNNHDTDHHGECSVCLSFLNHAVACDYQVANFLQERHRNSKLNLILQKLKNKVPHISHCLDPPLTFII